MKDYYNYARSASKGLGAIHIVIGLICIAINVASREEKVAELYYLGIAGGILFVVTGAFGILAGFKPSKATILICLLFSILSTMFAIAMLVLWSIEIDMLKERRESLDLYYAPLDVEQVIEKVAGLLTVTIVEVVTAFGSVIICLMTFCCQSDDYYRDDSYELNMAPIRPVVTQSIPDRPLAMQAAPVYSTVEKKQPPVEAVEAEPVVTHKSSVQPAVNQAPAVQPAVTKTSRIEPTVTETPIVQPAEIQTSRFEPAVAEDQPIQPAVIQTSRYEPGVTETRPIQPAEIQTSGYEPSVTDARSIQPAVIQTSRYEPGVIEARPIQQDVMHTRYEPAAIHTAPHHRSAHGQNVRRMIDENGREVTVVYVM